MHSGQLSCHLSDISIVGRLPPLTFTIGVDVYSISALNLIVNCSMASDDRSTDCMTSILISDDSTLGISFFIDNLIVFDKHDNRVGMYR